MYQKIMVPVDLEHPEGMQKALEVVADLAAHYRATVCYFGIAEKTPDRVARTPEAYVGVLADFARQQSEKYGIESESKAVASVDVPAEMDKTLVRVASEVGADLIVMASHIPGFADRMHLMSSHATHVARKAPMSVFIVRPNGHGKR